MSLQPPDAINVCPIIITYHPQNAHLNNIVEISKIFKKIIVVDNTNAQSQPQQLDELRSISGIELITNGSNLGIARALNIGVQRACDHGYPWVLTFDQDSQIEPSMIDGFSNVYSSLDEKEKIAVIGSNHIDLNSGQPYYAIPKNAKKSWVKRKTVVTSGSLVSTETFKNIGPFCERFFIDSVDHEFCLRARKKGYTIILSTKPLMKHAMGARTVHRFPLIPKIQITSSHYPPFRWYFITRNRLIVISKFCFSDFIWCASRLVRLAGAIGIMCLFEHDRMNKIKNIWWGVLDAATGRLNRKLEGLDGH